MNLWFILRRVRERRVGGREENSLLSLLGRLETKFLQQEPVTFLLDKKSGPKVAIAGLQHANAEFQAAVLSFVLDQEITDDVGIEKVPDDHFCLTLTVSIAFFRKGDVHPRIKVTGQLIYISRPHCQGNVVNVIIRSE